MSASSLHSVLGGGCMRCDRKLGNAVGSMIFDSRIGVRLGGLGVHLQTRHALTLDEVRVDGADADVGEKTRE